MSNSSSGCPKCGTALPTAAAEGLCPRCLFAQLEDPVPGDGAEVHGETGDSFNNAALGAHGNDDEFGDYELLEEIGQGGMGVVYRARQVSLNRPVAIKVIKQGMDTRSVIMRFEAERQVLAMMDHPGIAQVFDAGATRMGRPYFVMELVQGSRITRYCRERGLSTNDRLNLFIQVCDAVQYAHQKGIIHRDLKPSNILVAEVGGRPVVKIIDFGIAKAIENDSPHQTLITAVGQVLGTPAYLSPEQAEWSPTEAADVDTRSDIYSLGVLLYELLTGTLPFDPATLTRGGIEEWLRTIREVTPLRPSIRLSRDQSGLTASPVAGATGIRRGRHIPRDLDWIVMRCLEKDRRRRYETANGLAADIRRHLNHEPIAARPPSRLYELKMTVRRHWVGFGAAAAIVLALVVGLAGVGWQWRRAEATQLLARQNAYAADIRLAQQSVERGDLGTALGLLNKYRPGKSRGSTGTRSTDDLRGWEWRYLWSLCQSDEESTLYRYPSWIGGVVVATNLNLLAVQRGDGRIALWELSGRREITNILASGSRDTLDYSPAGNLLAAAHIRTTGQAEVKLWNLKNLVETAILPLEAPAVSLSLTTDGRYLATRDTRDRIIVWEIASGNNLARFEARSIGGWSTEAWSSGRLLRFSPDGTLLAFRDGRDRIRVMDWRAGRNFIPPLNSPPTEPALNRMLNQVTALAFSPDGRFLIGGHGSGTIYLWDLDTATMAGKLEGHGNWVLEMTFSPDGQHLASASADQTIRVWNLDDQRELRCLRGSEHAVLSVDYLPDQETLVSGGKDGSVRIWNAFKPEVDSPHRVLPFLFLAYTPDKTQFVALDSPRETLSLWDTHTLQPKETLTEFGADNVVFSLSRDGKWLAVNNRADPTRIRIVAWPSRKEATNLFLPSRSFGLNFSSDSQMLLANYYQDAPGLTVAEARETKRWRVGTWDEQPPPNIPLKPHVSKSRLSYDARLVAVGYETGGIEIRNAETGHLVASLSGFSSRVQDLAISLDGRMLAAAGLDEFVKVWDVNSGRELMTLRSDTTYNFSICFSPDSRRLAVGGVGGKSLAHRVQLWDLATQRQLLELPGGYANVAFPPQGDTLLVVDTKEFVSHLYRAPSWVDIAEAERSAEPSVPSHVSP